MVDLATRMQKLLFPHKKEARVASENDELFVNVMAEFSKFENEVCKCSNSFQNKCLSKSMLMLASSRVEIELKLTKHFQCC